MKTGKDIGYSVKRSTANLNTFPLSSADFEKSSLFLLEVIFGFRTALESVILHFLALYNKVTLIKLPSVRPYNSSKENSN